MVEPQTAAARSTNPARHALPARDVDAAAPIFIVMNAGSGHRDGDETRGAIEAVLREAGREFHLHLVGEASQLQGVAAEAVARARERRGIVVAAGGDGTINAVAQATLGSGCAFGVLPLGTFNYFSRTHGIPSEPAAAARQLLATRAHAVQVGLINERVFLVNASLGLYPQLLEDREQAKRQFGRSRLVALASAFGTLLREHRQLQLKFEASDGRAAVLRTPTLFVGNNRLQLEQLGIAQGAVIETQRLAALVLKPVGTLTMLGLLLRGAFGRLGDADTVRSFDFAAMSVSPYRRYGRRRLKVATDGEVSWMRTPIEFRVAEEPLWLLRPEVVTEDPG